MYPISLLIQQIIRQSGLRRSEFVASCGYRSIQGGLRKLDEWVEHGSGDDGCLQRIVNAYRPDPGDVERALAETEQIHQREHDGRVRDIENGARRRFKPFVWVLTEDGAHSFFTAIAERQVKVLFMPQDFERFSKADQLAAVQHQAREHYRRSGGKLIGFGAILRYQFTETFDTSIVLDPDGNVVEPQGGRFLLPEVWLELH